MTFNFFTPEQGFQKSLIDPAPLTRSKESHTSTPKRDAFKTEHSRQNNTEETTHNKDFNAVMKDLVKDKPGTHRTAQPANAVASDTAVAFNVPPENADAHAFQTPQNNLAAALNDIGPGLSPEAIQGENTQIDFANIATLKSEIQRLIEEHTDTQRPAVKDQIIVEDSSITEKIESIFSLLSSFLIEDHEQIEGHEQENASGNASFISILARIKHATNTEEALTITNGLTPEQLTKLQEHIEGYIADTLSQRDQKALEAFVSRWVSLTSPQQQERPQHVPTEGASSAESDINNITDPSLTSQKHHAQSRYDARYDRAENTPRADAHAPEAGNLKAASDPASAKSGAHQTQTGTGAAQTTGQQFLQMTGLSQNGLHSSTLNGDLVTTNAATITTAQATQSPLQNSLTNVITQSQSATHAHPATQMVSATIQRAVRAGEDTNIKLKLDPPELGRVEIKMSIDGDNGTRLVLTAEKPETYMMLKQDAEALERALNDAGLDAEGDLSFELAGDDHEFNQKDQQNAAGKQTGNQTNDGQNDDLIETTMDWSIDPDTGRMRYDVLV